MWQWGYFRHDLIFNVSCACLFHFGFSVPFSFSYFLRVMLLLTTRHPDTLLVWYSFLDLAHDLDPPKVHERTSHSHAVGLPNLVGKRGQAVKCETAKWCDPDRMLCLVRKSNPSEQVFAVDTLGLAVWPSQFHAAITIFIAVITIVSNWLYGSPMTFKHPPSCTAASLQSAMHVASNTYLCSWGLLSQCLNPLKGTAYISGTSSLGFFCILCDFPDCHLVLFQNDFGVALLH